MRQHIRQGFCQWDDVITGMDFDVDEAYSGEDAYVESVSFYDVGYGNVPAVTLWTTSGGEASYSTVSMNSDWLWDDASCEIDWDDDAADVRVVPQ